MSRELNMNTYCRVKVGSLASLRSLTHVAVAEGTCGEPKTKHVFSFNEFKVHSFNSHNPTKVLFWLPIKQYVFTEARSEFLKIIRCSSFCWQSKAKSDTRPKPFISTFIQGILLAKIRFQRYVNW